MTLIPAASAAAGFSPTAFKLSPVLVRFIKIATSTVIIIPTYTKTPCDKNICENQLFSTFPKNGAVNTLLTS